MRNLLGRLNARPLEDLRRIAAAWLVPVSGADKLGQVAQLYRAMRDPRAGRDMWDRLDEQERTLIHALSPGDETARSLAELADELGRDEAEVRQVATQLYRKGIVAREGDDEPLPVGQAPRLFLPRELRQLFEEVRDDIDAGDVSGAPLRALLARLDDAELEEAAQHWGARIVPGIRTRDEITRIIMEHVGEAPRLAALELRLKRDAARIWEVVRGVPDGKPAPLSEAAKALDTVADDPREAQRLRAALGELEEGLLVWHTFRGDGSRWLFVPNEIRSPGSRPRTESPAPEAVSPPEQPSLAQINEHAVAWDLLTLLRALSGPRDKRLRDVDEAPRAWLRAVNQHLWNRGADTPPPGYLGFLVDLARVEGLLTGGDVAVDEPFQLSTDMRAWRDRSFPEQTERLRAAWLQSATWIEGIGRDEVDVVGADWPGFRLNLLARLGQLEPGTWRRLEEVARWAAASDPDLLGTTFEVATARNLEIAGDEEASRQAAVAEVARITLEGAFAWFGLVELAQQKRQPRLIAVSQRGGALAAGAAVSAPEARERKPGMRVAADGEITLTHPTPLRVWSLTAFANPVELGAESRYCIDESSLARALNAGFEVRQVEQFLVGQSGSQLPAGFKEQLSAWAIGMRRVRAAHALRLTVDDPQHLSEVEAIARAGGHEVSVSGNDLFVIIDRPDGPTPQEARLFASLKEAGFGPTSPPHDQRQSTGRTQSDA
jgi:hypothetical protein